VQWLKDAGIPSVDLADGLNACGRLQRSAFPVY